jgi:hypothetical protein
MKNGEAVRKKTRAAACCIYSLSLTKANNLEAPASVNALLMYAVALSQPSRLLTEADVLNQPPPLMVY